MTLKSPYPWFGGKRRVMADIWQRLGDVYNFVDPFAGSMAGVLTRPDDHHWPRLETVNDIDGHVANFWRAVCYAPDEVANFADWPVSELDLHARGDWLFYSDDTREFVERMRADADFYDAKRAGWWVWFVAGWIGSLPDMSWLDGDSNAGQGVTRQLPHLGSTGQGVNRPSTSDNLREYMTALSERMRGVRFCCGDWQRICGPTPTVKQGLTGVLLDPPYSAEAGRNNKLYSHESLTVAHDVRAWALANGDNPLMRIALCGYTGEGHEELLGHGWTANHWKAHGGYSSQNGKGGNGNRHREVVYFSPHCLQIDKAKPMTLFEVGHYK